MGPQRVPIIDLPTTAEAGLDGVDATVWNGFFYPKGTPREIVLKMNKALNEMIERPDVKKRMAEFGLTILPPEQRTPEYLAAFLPQGHRALGQGDPRCGPGRHGGEVMAGVTLAMAQGAERPPRRSVPAAGLRRQTRN